MTDSGKHLSYHPTEGLCYDPEDPVYWEDDMLEMEIFRAFEICQGCRMCFKFCDAFPALFDLVDGRCEGDVRRLGQRDVQRIMDACFQCKLCEVQCPYTPRDGHEFQLDFPKLVHRYKAVHRRGRAPTLRERFLGDPDASGKLARASGGLVNRLNRSRLQRRLMEKSLGIHRDKLLPDFASVTFERLAERTGRVRLGPPAEVVVFQTCFVQHNDPQIGLDLLYVLEKNGVDATCVRGLVCCGMPAWESGDLETLRANARNNLDRLMPYVRAGAKVLVLNPTCAMMMRREYPELLSGQDRARAQVLAEAVRDPGEYLWSIRRDDRFDTGFKSTPGRVAYHAPCHLRVQAVGFKGRDLLKKIPGVSVATVMECCGHNGTYAMTVEGFAPSQRIGRRAFDAMVEADAKIWATECPLAAVQFQQHAGVKPLHPMTILARAYRTGGFPTPVSG